MTSKSKKTAANAAILSGVGLFGASQALDLPSELVNFSEPIGLIFGLIGAILRVIEFFKKSGK